MAGTVNAQYIKDHMANVHTSESWARSVTEQALNEAVKKLAGGSANSVTLDAKFHITAFEPKGCIQVCSEIGGVVICTHINI